MGLQRRARPYLILRCVCGLALLAAAWTARASEYHGRLMYGGVPVPGATVTVTEGAKVLSTLTDSQGLYEFPDLAYGVWQIQIAMSGFAPLENQVTVAPNLAQGEWEIQLLPSEKLLADAKPAEAVTVVLQPRVPEVKPEKKAEKKTEAAPQGAPAAPPPPEPDAASDKSSNGLLINGSETKT